jgi:hypothetical protein
MAMLAILGTISVGCGGGDDEGSGVATTVAASSITKAQFVKKANAICQKGKAQLAGGLAAFVKLHEKEPVEDTAVIAAKTILRPNLQAQVDQIRTLGAPRDDVAEIEAFSVALLNGIDQIVIKESSTTQESMQLLRPAGNVALKYGIDQCAYGY